MQELTGPKNLLFYKIEILDFIGKIQISDYENTFNESENAFDRLGDDDNDRLGDDDNDRLGDDDNDRLCSPSGTSSTNVTNIHELSEPTNAAVESSIYHEYERSDSEN